MQKPLNLVPFESDPIDMRYPSRNKPALRQLLADGPRRFDQSLGIVRAHIHRQGFLATVEMAVDCHLGAAHGVFHGEYAVVRHFGKLAEKSEVGGTPGDHLGAVAGFAGHEQAVDVGHGGGDAVDLTGLHHGSHQFLHPEVIPEFFEDLLPGALGHLFLYVIADAVHIQAIAPEDLHVLGLVGEVRLAGDDDGHQPVGVGQGH